MDDDIAISVEHVSKNFVLPHQRVGSLKGYFTGQTRQSKAKSKETQHALHDISFSVKKGEFFGIVGRNGSGKSTMLKILANIYQPTTGKVSTKGKLVPFIELGVGFNPELTGRENIYLNGAMLGFSQKEVGAMYNDIVDFAELGRFMDQKLKNYSSGMQVRLAFSMATRSEADILLVDEVLAVGDADFQRKCFDYFRTLKRDKKTVVFVTHDMEAIREYCDRAILIEDSKLVHGGSPNEVAQKYSRMFIQDSHEEKQTIKGKRWGDKGMVFTKIKVPTTLTSSQPLSIVSTAIAQEDIEEPVFGFMIKNAAGQPLLGTNSKIKRHRTGNFKKGQTVEISWEIPNIFSDGKYYIDPAIVRSDGIQPTDWWEDACSFTVYKEDRTPYVVTPEIKLITER